ncbi:MAG: type II secretion system F family protein [Gemmataceae bacterium]|nr:type II secretion system F family protein [Gemmataceae bacterium]
MPFSRQLPPAPLAELCRVLRHNLGAGLTLRDVFRQQAQRGPAVVRPVAERIRGRLEHGDSFQAALADEAIVFPPLFLAMASVGEETGHLPEVFEELENYYTLQARLRREFWTRSFLSLVQIVAAIFVIGVMLLVLGLVGGGQGPSVLGVRGWAAGVVFLALGLGMLALLLLVPRILARAVQNRAGSDALLLRLPGLGPCLEALALGRFALALRLTLDSALPVGKALRLSLQATGNAAFIARTDEVVTAVKRGDDLTLALSAARIFPEQFLHMVAVGEEGGRIPELMRHQAAYYHEEAGRRMKVLTRGLSFAVWLAYAAFLVIAIFQLAGRYFRALG